MVSAGIALSAVALVALVVWLLGAREQGADEAVRRLEPPLSFARSISPDDTGQFRTELRARYEAQLRETGQSQAGQA